jgi:DNA-binding MarR family transcriptional regulator
MRQARKPSLRSTAALEENRRRNLRQLLLRASRIVNRHVVEGLHARGYHDLRSTHTTLLSNLHLSGGTITEVAARAGITKQAMGRLAFELEGAGYIAQRPDSSDRRARHLALTASGYRLMQDSFDVMAELERRYARALGGEVLVAVLAGLTAFVEKMERDE